MYIYMYVVHMQMYMYTYTYIYMYILLHIYRYNIIYIVSHLNSIKGSNEFILKTNQVKHHQVLDIFVGVLLGSFI